MIEGRNFLCEEINKIPGFHAFPSEGNFVLIDATALGKPASEIVQDMIARGVFLRPMSGHHLDGFIRVTVWTPEENRHFLEKLNIYVAEVRQSTRED